MRSRGGAQSGERWRVFEANAGEAMQAYTLDLLADVGFCSAQPESPTLSPQPASEHRQIDHQRSVGECELAEIDNDVALGAKGTRQSLPSTALSGSILVSATPQGGGLFAEVDDPSNL